MAFERWVGRAQAVAQVDTVTIANTWAQDDTVTLTINDKSLVVTIGTLITTAQVATTIKQAWENETLTDTSASFTPATGGQGIVEHAEITATVASSVVSLTHDTAGTPFTLTVTEATAGDGTALEATATAATGPNHWDNTANWEPGVNLPGADASDDVVIENSAVSILYGLDQNAITNNLASLTISRNYTGTIGLPRQNAAGYVEYRDEYLKIPADIVTIGRGDGAGSGRIKLDTHDATAAITIVNTGSSVESPELEAVLLKGAAAVTLVVIEGSVAVAAYEDETAVVTSCFNSTGTIRLGEGITAGVTTVKNESGTILTYADITTLTNSNGTVTIAGSSAVTTFVLDAGNCTYQTSGDLGTLTIGGSSGATFDASQENSARTITTLNLKPNAEIVDPLNSLTYTTIVFDSTVQRWSTS